ncbi:transporter substrate-binding domain-containing protein [Brevibacillus sp. NRS-1366]|uniref:transporter substrate-binding domain-containing protein n=1 Tax=Brevibacillus sp. NRS-1366 TaxID=3233899 RepID=UPI003D203BB6
MKKIKRFSVLAAATGLLALALAGCGSNSATDGQASSSGGTKVSVAALNNYPPLTYKKDGQLVGFEIDLLTAIAKIEKLEPEYKEMKFDGFIPALQAKQVDLATSVLIREERKQVVDFTDTYLTSGLVLVVKNDSDIKSYEDLKGRTIVATQGSTTLVTAKELAEKYGATTSPLKETDAVYLAVETGNADALVMNSPTNDYRMKLDGDNQKFRVVGDYLTTDESAFAITKGNEELKNKLNEGLKKLKENGEYDKIYEAWFGAKP